MHFNVRGEIKILIDLLFWLLTDMRCVYHNSCRKNETGAIKEFTEIMTRTLYRLPECMTGAQI